MLDIKSLCYEIRFLNNTVFAEDAELAFFKIIYSRLKRILCIDAKKNCSECSNGESCLYNYLSSGDFVEFDNIPVILKKPLISKKIFREGETLNIEFTFLGNSALHIDFFNYIMKELEINGLFEEKYRFLIINKKIIKNSIENTNMKVAGIDVLSPIDSDENIFEKEKTKIEKLNNCYNITNADLSIEDIKYETHMIGFDMKNNIYIGANRLKFKGYIGRILFTEPIENNSFLQLLKIIGMGRLYGLGGGNIKLYI